MFLTFTIDTTRGALQGSAEAPSIPFHTIYSHRQEKKGRVFRILLFSDLDVTNAKSFLVPAYYNNILEICKNDL